MRVPRALAAIAALGALVYGAADPLHSALTASDKASESSQEASLAAAAARVKVKVPRAPKASTFGQAAHGAAPLAAAAEMAAPVTVPHLGTPATAAAAAPDLPDLADVAAARDKHRAIVPAAAAAAAAKPGLVTTVQPGPVQPAPLTPAPITPAPAKPAPAKPAPAKVVTQPPVRRIAPLVPRVYSTQESYGPASSQRVTISRLNTSIGRRPTVYFVHGGAWIAGGRGEWAAEASRWAAKGWTAVNISYRLNVQGRLMLSDIQTVVSVVESRPYVNPEQQIIVGSSAGAHLATSVAVRHPEEFRGVIAWSPVISPEAAATGAQATTNGTRLRLANAARRLWGSNWRAATPVSYVSGQTPPLWAAAARGEWLHWSDQGELLCAALGKRCTVNLVPGQDHGAHLAQTHALLRQRALIWATARVGAA